MPIFSKLLLCLTSASLVFWASTARSDGTQIGSAILDGMIYVGQIGPAGNPDFDEELHFNGLCCRDQRQLGTRPTQDGF